MIESRYGQINRFERDLEAAGKTILKLCLHISWEEQRQRLLLRLELPPPTVDVEAMKARLKAQKRV